MSLSKRSPILRPLLKLPGQQLDDDLQNLVEDQFLAPIMALVMIAGMCIIEWSGYLTNSPRNPWIYTWWLVGSFILFVIHWRRQWHEAARLKLGRDGERAVAECLNMWLDPDSRVLHGVPLESGVADHVLVCSRGVFVVETKTRRFPTRGEPVVHVSDVGLRVNGFKPDRDPIVQVSRYVDALNRLLPKLTASKVEASGIVVFPSVQGDRRSVRRSIRLGDRA